MFVKDVYETIEIVRYTISSIRSLLLACASSMLILRIAVRCFRAVGMNTSVVWRPNESCSPNTIHNPNDLGSSPIIFTRRYR